MHAPTLTEEGDLKHFITCNSAALHTEVLPNVQSVIVGHPLLTVHLLEWERALLLSVLQLQKLK